MIEYIPNTFNITYNDNVFKAKEQAKSVLTFAQLSQVLYHYNTDVDWSNNQSPKYVVLRYNYHITVSITANHFNPFAFPTKEEAERFLSNNRKLLETYYMLES